MIRVKYPIEYELDPGTLEKGIQWITLRLKNVGKFAQSRYKNAFDLDCSLIHSIRILAIAFYLKFTSQ